MCAFRRAGPPKVKTVSKIRRTRTQAYGSNWDATSAQTISLAGHRCSRCGTAGSKTNKLRAHHVIQVSKGGKTIPFYLKCLCDNCHELQPGHGHLRERRLKK
jgi:5-methylcytosine-specific restriction endonuclease McrA